MGLGSILGKIGKGVAKAAAGPFGPLIDIGLGLGGTVLGSKLAKSKPSEMEQRVLNSNLEAQKRGMDLSGTLVPQATSMFSKADPALSLPIDYNRKLLSGDKATATSAMAPEINRINEGYRTATKTSAALQPRGGPSAAVRSNLPFQQQRDVSTLMQTARPQAGTNLFNMGTGVQLAGSNLLNNAIQALYMSTSSGRDVLLNEQARQDRDSKTGESIGGSIFGVLKDIDWGKIAGKTGG